MSMDLKVSKSLRNLRISSHDPEKQFASLRGPDQEDRDEGLDSCDDSGEESHLGSPIQYNMSELKDCHHFRTTEKLQECSHSCSSSQGGERFLAGSAARRIEIETQGQRDFATESDLCHFSLREPIAEFKLHNDDRIKPSEQNIGHQDNGSTQSTELHTALLAKMPNDNTKKDTTVSGQSVNKLRSVIGGFLLHVVFGSQYIWGNISVYCVSHFYLMDKNGKEGEHRSMGDYQNVISLGLPLIVVSSMIAMPLGSQLLKALSKSRISKVIAPEKIQTFVACSICVAGTFLATSESFLSLASDGHSRLLLFTAAFSISFGIGNGLGYTIPLKVCWELFPNRKGMITGVIICGFGVGSFVFGIASTMLINPNNQEMELVHQNHVYGPLVADNSMGALRVLAVCWAGLSSIALLLMKVKEDENTTPESKKEEVENDEDLTLAELLTDKRFWLLYFMNFCTVFYGYMLIGSYKVFGGAYIHDDMFLTLVGSIGCVCGSLRFIWSILLDHGYSYRQVYGSLCTIQLACAALTFAAASNGYKYLFLILVALSMFCEGGHFVLLPSHCAQLFGSSKRGVQAFSVLFSCFGLSSLAGSLLNGYLQARGTDPYNKMFALSTLLTLIAKLTLVYYDRLLESHVTDTFEAQSWDDGFVRVPAAQGDNDIVDQLALLQSRIERKNQLADQMYENDLKRSGAPMSGLSDSDSQYSRTTRNTLLTSTQGSTRPGIPRSPSAPKLYSKRAGHASTFFRLRNDEGPDDSSSCGDSESFNGQPSFFGSPIKDSERDDNMQNFFMMKLA